MSYSRFEACIILFELNMVEADDMVACEVEPLACEIEGVLDMARKACGRLLFGFMSYV